MIENNGCFRKLNMLIDEIELDDMTIYFKRPIHVCGNDEERWLDGIPFVRVELWDGWLKELKWEVGLDFVWSFYHCGRAVLPRTEEDKRKREAYREIVDIRKTQDSRVYGLNVEVLVKSFDGKTLVLQRLWDDEPFDVDLSKEVEWTAPRSPHVSDYLQRLYVKRRINEGWKEICYIEDAWH